MVKILNIFLVKLFLIFFFNFFLIKKNFVAPDEHGFPFFQVKMFTGSVSELLTSTSLKIKNQKNKNKNKIRHAVLKIFEQLYKIFEQLYQF